MERKSNIELLRIVAMFMIVGSHLACHGVQSQLLGNNAYQIWNDGSEINKIFVSFLNPGGGGGGGVALFFIITGYFQVKKEKVTVKKVALETILYGWSISLLWIVATIMGLTRKAETHVSLLVLLKQFFNPLLSGAWWFVTVYIIVLFNSPLINKIIKNKSKRSFSVALILMWMIGYTLPCFEEAAYFEIYRGVFFYCVGAYIKQSGKCDIKVDKRAPYIFAFIVAWIMGTVLYHIYGYTCLLTESKTAIFVGKICMTGFHATVVPICSISLFTLFARIKTAVNHMLLYSRISIVKYIYAQSISKFSPFMLVIAFALFCMCINRRPSYSKSIEFLSRAVLPVYLIHESDYTSSILWDYIFKIEEIYSKSYFAILFLGIAVLIFSICVMVDFAIRPIYGFAANKVAEYTMLIKGNIKWKNQIIK